MQNKPGNSQGRLAQMVEHALQKFSTQQDRVRTGQAQGFFFKSKLICILMLDFDSKKVMCFSHEIYRDRNQGVFTLWVKRAIWRNGPCKYLPSNTSPAIRRYWQPCGSNTQEMQGGRGQWRAWRKKNILLIPFCLFLWFL